MKVKIRDLTYDCETLYELIENYDNKLEKELAEKFQELIELIMNEENEDIKLKGLGVLYDIQKNFFVGNIFNKIFFLINGRV